MTLIPESAVRQVRSVQFNLINSIAAVELFSMGQTSAMRIAVAQWLA